MKKKALSFLLIVVMMLSFSICAFADAVQVTFVANMVDPNANVQDMPDEQPSLSDGVVEYPGTEPTADGYVFKGWYQDQACTTKWIFLGDPSGKAATIATSKRNTIYAKWAAVNTVNVSSGAGGDAIATVNDNPVDINDLIEEGETVTVTAVPDPNYMLKSITVENESGNAVPGVEYTENGCSFKMPKYDVIVSVDFTESLGVWVGGVPVTPENKDNIFADSGKATARYDSDSSTLYLEDANITGAYNGSAIYFKDGIAAPVINVKGNNTVTSNASRELKNGSDEVIAYNSYGIAVMQGSVDPNSAPGTLTIRGDGNITIRSANISGSSKTGNQSTGILLGGPLTVCDSVNVKTYGGNAAGGTSYGVCSPESIVIDGTASIAGFGNTKAFYNGNGAHYPDIRYDSRIIHAGDKEPGSEVADPSTVDLDKKYVKIEPSVDPTGVEFNDGTSAVTVITLKEGESKTLQVNVLPKDKTLSSSKVNITTDDANKEYIDVTTGNGTITIKGKKEISTGKTITATTEKPANSPKVATLTVIVEEGQLSTEVKTDRASATIANTGKTAFTATAGPAGVTDDSVVWTIVDDKGIVKITDQDGYTVKVSAIKNGTATLKATAHDGSGAYKTVQVKVTGEYKITYPTTSLVWLYDRPEDILVRCSGPYDDFSYVTIDGTIVDGRYLTVRELKDGSTEVVVDEAWLTSHLPKVTTKYQMVLYYSTGEKVSKTLYARSIKDAPITGDVNMASLISTIVLSGMSAAGTGWYIKKKK